MRTTTLAKNDTTFWNQRRGKIFSRKGGWKVGQGVYCHGYDMMSDLVGKASYFQVMMLNVLGYLPERQLADCLEAMFICVSWPEPRIWCNQIGALAGTLKTQVVGATASGTLAADSVMYGSRPVLEGVKFIQSAHRNYCNGNSVATIVEEHIAAHRGKVHIVGYARPLVRGDERVPAMEKVVEQYDIEPGPHLRLAYKIAEYLKENYGEDININGFVSAFLSDYNLTPEQIYQLVAMCVMSGVTACYLEEHDKPAESFLPLRCDDIDYQGTPPRHVP